MALLNPLVHPGVGTADGKVDRGASFAVAISTVFFSHMGRPSRGVVTGHVCRHKTGTQGTWTVALSGVAMLYNGVIGGLDGGQLARLVLELGSFLS